MRNGDGASTKDEEKYMINTYRVPESTFEDEEGLNSPLPQEVRKTNLILRSFAQKWGQLLAKASLQLLM